MQDFNFHTHTKRCNHAVGTDEEYVLAAIQAGFKTLGFSDHNPIPDDPGIPYQMLESEVPEYLASIRSLKEKYKDQIEIFVGFECEYFPDRPAFYENLRQQCDYLILGQHAKKPGIDFCHQCKDEDVPYYADYLVQGMATGLFTYVAHPDYFLISRNQYTPVCDQAVDHLIEGSLRYQVPLELNLGASKYGSHRITNTLTGESVDQIPYPNPWVWKKILDANCTIVMGYDAHDPKFLLQRDLEEKRLAMLPGKPHLVKPTFK